MSFTKRLVTGKMANLFLQFMLTCVPGVPWNPGTPMSPRSPRSPQPPKSPWSPFSPLGPSGPSGPTSPGGPSGPLRPGVPGQPKRPLSPGQTHHSWRGRHPLHTCIRSHEIMCIKIKSVCIKGRVARDFFIQVFFINNLPQSL
jgi:hypothetical protein